LVTGLPATIRPASSQGAPKTAIPVLVGNQARARHDH